MPTILPHGQGPGSRTDPDVYSYAQQEYFERRCNPTQVADFVNRRFGPRTVTAEGVRKWVRSWGQDSSGPWGIRSSDPETSREVLAVIAELVDAGIPAAQSLTIAEAELIGRLAVVVPDMPKDAMYLWARQFIVAESTGGPTADLMTFLAFRPWTDGGIRYQAAADNGHLTRLLAFGRGADAQLGGKARLTADLVTKPRSRRFGSATASAILGEAVARQPDAQDDAQERE
jgi:hypothetical protein